MSAQDASEAAKLPAVNNTANHHLFLSLKILTYGNICGKKPASNSRFFALSDFLQIRKLFTSFCEIEL